ncbi:CGI-121-domain-containing protein [Meredithblackwellia eburnea MCA 4105]
METYPLQHGTTVTLALFTDVKNAPQIKDRLVNASTLPDDAEGNAEREALNFSFLDASMVTSRIHVLTAVSQALIAQSHQALKTKTLQSEVLYELEPGTNITESLRHFGLSSNTTSALLVHFDSGSVDEKGIYERMKRAVEGQLASLDWLEATHEGLNMKGLRKLYKVNQDAALKGVVSGSVEERGLVDSICSSTVALKPAA